MSEQPASKEAVALELTRMIWAQEMIPVQRSGRTEAVRSTILDIYVRALDAVNTGKVAYDAADH